MSTCKNNTHSKHGHCQPPPLLATHTRQAIWRIAPDKPGEHTGNDLILKNPLREIKEFLVRVRVGLSLSHSHPRHNQSQSHSHTQRHNRGRNRLVYAVLLMLVLLSLLLTSCSSSDILGDQSADQNQSAQDSPKLTLQPTDFGGGDIGKTVNNILITIATAPASFIGNLSLTSLDWLLHFSQSVRFDWPDGQRVCGFSGGGSWNSPTTNSGAVSLQPLTQCATQVYDGMKFMPISLLLLAIFPFLLKYVIGGFLGGGGSLTDFLIKGIAVILFSINMDTMMTLLVALPMRLFFYILQVNTGSTTVTTGQAASGSSQQDAWIKQLTDGFSPLFKLDSSVHNNNLPFAWLISILAIITALAILAIGLAFLVRSFLLIFWFILSPLSLSSLLLEETSGFFYAWQGRVLAQVVSILPLAVVLRIAVVLEGAFPNFKGDVFSLLVLMASEAILLGISLVMAWKFLTSEMKQHLQLAGQGFGVARSLVSGSLGAAGGVLTAPYRAARYGYRKADAIGEALLGTQTFTDDGTERSTGYLGGLMPGVGPWRTIDKRSSDGGSRAGGGTVQSSTSAAAVESAGGAEVEYASSTAPQYSWPQVGAGAGSNSSMMGGGSSDSNEMAQAMRGLMSSMQLSSLGGVGRMAPPPPPRPALTSTSAGGGTATARSNQTTLLPNRGGAGSNATKAGQNGAEMGTVALTSPAGAVAASNERQTQLLNDVVAYGGSGFGANNADAFYYGGAVGAGSAGATGYYGGNGGGNGQAPVNNLAQSYAGSDSGEVGSSNDGGNGWDAASSLAALTANSQLIDPATGRRLDFGQVLPALANMDAGSPAPNPSPVAVNSGAVPTPTPVQGRPAITARPAQRLNGGQSVDNGAALSDPLITPQLGSYSAPTQPLIGSSSSGAVSGLADNFGVGTPPVAPAASATNSMAPSPIAAPLPVVVPPPPPPPLPQMQTQAQPVPHSELGAAGGDVSSIAAPTAQPSTATPSVGVAPMAPAPITPLPPLATGAATPPVSSGSAKVKNVMSNNPDQLIQPLPLNIAGASSGPIQPSSAAQPLPASSAGGVTPLWPGGGTGPSNSLGDTANSFSGPPAAGNGGMYEGLVNPGSSATAPSAGFGAALPTIPPPPPMLSFTSPLPDTGTAPGSGAGVGLPPTMGQPQQQSGSGNVPPNNTNGNKGPGQPGSSGMGS